VVEEAPSPFVTPKIRRALGEQAIALAQAVGYYSAGTVELIVSGADPSGESFYFLEMNTRLQVEHPVTEAITGVDLVEQMIRIAAGEKLGFSQDDIGIDGWAIETRVYAEDPYRGFLPSTGRLVRYGPPAAKLHQAPFSSPLGEGDHAQHGGGDSRPGAALAASPHHHPSGGPPPRPGEEYIRLDDGVAEGGEVSMFYDPMIAKLITWAPSRNEAAALQVEALDQFRIEGLGHNVDFLSAIMQHPRFLAGELTTGFIAEEWPDGFHGAPASEELLRKVAAVAATVACTTEGRAREIDGQLGDYLDPPYVWIVTIGDRDFTVDLTSETKDVVIEGQPITVEHEYYHGDRTFPATVDGESLTFQIHKTRLGFNLRTRGAQHVARCLPVHIAPLARHMIEKVPPDLSKFLLAPMPGLLTQLLVAPGDKVEAGQPLAVVEAMKMENILRAERAGTVKAANFAAGDSLAVDAAILEFD
jgi:propionyl-CoA carboxylase alpha chain